MPTRVIWGEHDSYLSVDSVGRPLAELFGAELIVLPGGHFLPLEKPDLVAAEVLTFLRGDA